MKKCPTCKAYTLGEMEGERKEGRKLRRRNEKITDVMGEYERGELRSGSKKGPKVKSRDQALAIGYSSARKANRKKKRKK